MNNIMLTAGSRKWCHLMSVNRHDQSGLTIRHSVALSLTAPSTCRPAILPPCQPAALPTCRPAILPHFGHVEALQIRRSPRHTMSVNAHAGDGEADEHAAAVVAAAIGDALAAVVVNLDALATETGGGLREGDEAEGESVMAEGSKVESGSVVEEGGEVANGGEQPEDGENLEDRYVFMSTEEALEGGLPRGERIRPSPGSLTSSYHGQAGRGTTAPDELSSSSGAPSEGLWLTKAGDPARTLGLNLPWTRKRRWFILR